MTATRLDAPARAARDRLVLAAYAAGATQAAIARDHGMTEGGVSRILARHGASPDRAEFVARRLRAPRKVGPRPIWPNVPPHLEREYLRVRAIIGSRAARDQLLLIDARPRAPHPAQQPGSRK